MNYDEQIDKLERVVAARDKAIKSLGEEKAAVTKKYQAKNPEELKKKAPEAHKLFEKYGVNSNIN